MITVGLTGQIASGKSTIAKMLHKKGAIIIDADIVGHDLLKKKETKARLQEEFGNELFSNHQVDRLKLAKIAFNSKENIDKLNNIMWPLIIDYIENAVVTISEKLPPSSVVIIEAALLFEAGWDKSLNIIVSVLANKEKQINRLEKIGFTENASKARIAKGSNIKELIKKSDYIIYNNDNEQKLEQEVEKLWQFIKKAKN